MLKLDGGHVSVVAGLTMMGTSDLNQQLIPQLRILGREEVQPVLQFPIQPLSLAHCSVDGDQRRR